MTGDIVLLLQDCSDSVSPRDWGQGQCLAGRFSFADTRNAVKMRASFRQNHKVSMLVPGTFSFFSCVLGSFSLSLGLSCHLMPISTDSHWSWSSIPSCCFPVSLKTCLSWVPAVRPHPPPWQANLYELRVTPIVPTTCTRMFTTAVFTRWKQLK